MAEIYLADSGLTGIIENIGGEIQVIGITMAGVSIVALGAFLLFAFMGDGGLRKHLSKALVIGLVALLIGGGAALGPMLVDTGGQIGDAGSGGSESGGGFN